MKRRIEQGREEEEEEEGKGEEREEIQVWIKCILMSRIFGMNFPWRLVAPCSRVLWKDHINPRILEVLWEKH